MIGKSLNQRHTLSPLAPERAGAIITEMLETQARSIVELRARDEQMIACLVVRADQPTVRLCRALGFDVKRGGTAAFGLLGPDAATLFAKHAPLAEQQIEWLGTPCGPRETKVLLLAGGIALVSLETKDGTVTVSVAV